MRARLPWLIMLFAAAIPLWLSDPYILHILIIMLLYAVLAMSLNIVSGMAGQISVGHAAFHGIGAYTAALLMLHFNLAYWPAALCAGLVAALAGALLGSTAMRIRGNYLCIVTLGFGEIVRLTLLNWSSLTRGPMGISGIPEPQLFGWLLQSKADYYWLILALFVVSYLLIRRIEHTAPGVWLFAVKNNEIAARSIGIRSGLVKMAAFAVGAFFAGVCGSFFAVYTAYINPDSFGFSESIAIMCMVVIGGQGNTRGVLLGALLLAAVPELLRAAADYRMVFYGLALILCIVFRPQGLYGVRFRHGVRGRSAEETPSSVAKAGTASPDQTAPLLQLDQIGIHFGGIQALNGVSFSMQPGELVGLIGPNGAGKTTLFNIISGIYAPTDGSLLIDGQRIRRADPVRLRQLGVTRTFQNIRLFHELTALENVYAASLTGPWWQRWRDCAALLDLVGLSHRTNQQAGSLAYGEQRRLEIARALATRPRLLLLDEPAAGMNDSEKAHLQQLIRHVHDQLGIGVLMIEHDMRFIMQLCPRIVALSYGEVIASGQRDAVANDPAVIEAYMGRRQELAHA